jgi:hypothetical protein
MKFVWIAVLHCYGDKFIWTSTIGKPDRGPCPHDAFQRVEHVAHRCRSTNNGSLATDGNRRPLMLLGR